MKPRTIVIGDIHGCATALRTLLKAIDPQADDTIVTLGDYVDRGPQSSGVVQTLVELSSKSNLVPLLGNHELMMLQAPESPGEMEFWLSCGGEATLRSYRGSLDNVPAEHWEFFEQCRRHFENDSHFFVHANYVHNVSLDKQPDHVLLWEHIGPNVPPPHQNGKIAVVGHTPQVDGSVRDLGHLILLDTYCFGGMWLTALDLTNGVVYQANEAEELYREDIP